ncbi:MAG: hypothetical protein KBB01_00825 [Candidatus Omnitrophica bacterium]|jgi:methionyl-tRNA synthetase|nr:hypothetical protein [Candidatus Omnitrophota bacterium]
MINFDDFLKLDLRIGRILEVEVHPDAEKLYLLKVDIGEKVVQVVAGIRPFYSTDSLINKLVVVLANLEPKNIRGALSEAMLLAAQGKDDLGLLMPDKEIPQGSTIH